MKGKSKTRTKKKRAKRKTAAASRMELLGEKNTREKTEMEKRQEGQGADREAKRLLPKIRRSQRTKKRKQTRQERKRKAKRRQTGKTGNETVPECGALCQPGSSA